MYIRTYMYIPHGCINCAWKSANQFQESKLFPVKHIPMYMYVHDCMLHTHTHVRRWGVLELCDLEEKYADDVTFLLAQLKELESKPEVCKVNVMLLRMYVCTFYSQNMLTLKIWCQRYCLRLYTL